MQQYIIKKVEVQHSISSESINHSIFLFQFAKHYKLLTNLMLLTKLTNFLKGCELVKRVLYLGTGVVFMYDATENLNPVILLLRNSFKIHLSVYLPSQNQKN